MRRTDLVFLAAALAPVLVLVWVWIAYPLAYEFFQSVHAFDIVKPGTRGDFVGFDNYLGVATSYYFVNSLLVTAAFAAITIPLIISVSLATALVLNEETFASGPMQVLALIPWSIPYVVTGTMFKWIYDANYGILNFLLRQVGLIPEYQAWLTQPWSTMMLLAVAYVWAQYPLPTILFLARLKMMPTDVQEASVIDGAGAFSRFRHVTVTWLRPILQLNVIYQTIMAIAAFDLIYVITSGGPFDFTSTIAFFAYREAFQFFNWGYALALSVIIFVIGLAVVYLYLKALPAVRFR